MEEHKRVVQLLQNKNRLNFTDLKRLFFLMRNNNIKFSDAIIEIGLKLTKNHKSQLSNDYYIVLQELFQAYVDMNLIHPADVQKSQLNIYKQQVLKQLVNKFDKAEKIQRLRGVLLEAIGEDENAQVQYEGMIQENLIDQGTRKRKISLLRVNYLNRRFFKKFLQKKGEIEQAIQQLNAYLISFPQDSESWLELADIYLENMNFHKALFCYEELLLLQPADQHYIVKIAELYFNLNGSSNMDVAKNYYCFVLSKNSENTRAQWGLLQTLRKLAKLNKSSKSEYKELVDVTIMTIKKCYQRQGQTQLISKYPFDKILNEF